MPFSDFRILGLLLLTVMNGMAQDAGTVRGSVAEVDGGPLHGATILVTSTTSNLSYSFWSEGNGTFRVTNVVPATYKITIRYGGFREKDAGEVWIGPETDADLGVQTLIPLGLPSIDCANISQTQTKEAPGPSGVKAVLRVYSADDHMRDLHDCQADYSLRITQPDGTVAVTGPNDFFSSDADWGRRLTVHLDGFSQDGKHVFGIISEGGKDSFTAAFDFEIARNLATLIKIKQGLQVLRGAKCGTAFAVAGTAASGAMVVEPNTVNPCRTGHRWLLNRSGELQVLSNDQPLVGLYKPLVP